MIPFWRLLLWPNPKTIFHVSTLMRTIIVLLIMTISSTAMADDLFSRTQLWQAYPKDPLVTQAQQQGLSAAIFKAIDKPATPMARRAALIDAVISSQKTKDLQRLYTLHLLKRRGKTTIARLSTPELFSLGWMRARQRPKNLGNFTGKSELERADALTLLGAAANRMRGEMTVNLLHGAAKAQRAINTPKQALCQPNECIDQVLQNHPKHWSMPKLAVCNLVAAVGQLSKPTTLGARLCKHQKTGVNVVTAAPSAPKGPQHKRFSHQYQPQPPRQAPTVRFVQPNLQGMDPRMAILFRRMQQQIQRQIQSTYIQGGTLQNVRPHNQPGHASPKTIELKSNPSSNQTPPIAIDRGNVSTSPRRPNKEILLTPTEAQDDKEDQDNKKLKNAD